ncbi:hypothetical protein LTR37_016679 [Vermiconidia calcicola]|uniref:Uncharacterized protein n=1 Tax=Vermiconidia calcicola TaxID=1690605 RepID=A0ACC3MNA8_9PEZI|nr:hypothetical protein LTR37_016679 [Vermiconidia calcicola]
MFRTGVYAAQHYNTTYLASRIDDGLDIHYNVTGTSISPINVFQTDFSYFAGAAVVDLLCVLVRSCRASYHWRHLLVEANNFEAILYTFHGWWRLGRATSFSPQEIAKAFDAPLLHNLPSNLDGKCIARQRGCRKVQYGVVTDMVRAEDREHSAAAKKLAVADKEAVHKVSGARLSLKEYYGIIRTAMFERLDRIDSGRQATSAEGPC